jgi:hypothetical protein
MTPLDKARRILTLLPADPHAGQHLTDLAHAVMTPREARRWLRNWRARP